MKRWFWIAVTFLLCTALAYGGTTYNPHTGKFDIVPTVEEEDGDPTVYAPTTIKVTNGALTDNGDGSVSLSTGGSVEGTAVLSTGEAGGTKYLREDGDGTCSWQTPAGSGDLLADGSVPMTANWDIGNFDITLKALTGDGTIEGATLTEGGIAVHNNDQMDASSELAAIIDDETGSGLITFATSPQFTTSFTTAGAFAINPGGALTIGDGGDTLAINSSDWDIDATGVATGMGNITSDGTVEGATITEGGQAVYNATETPGGELEGTWATPTLDNTGITLTSVTVGSLLGVDSIDATGAVDMDYGSADITDHTFTTDGGTAILDGLVSTSQGATAGAVRIYEPSGSGTNYTEIQGVATAANLEWILPASNGTAGQILEIASVASNTLTLEWDDDGGAGGATAYDDIGDPDANGSIAMGAYTGTYTSATDGWGGLYITNTVADMTSEDWLLNLTYTDDGDAEANFLRCLDNSSADVQFEIAANGDTTIGDGSSGSVDFGTNTINDTLAGNLQKGYVHMPVQSAKLTGGYVTQGDATQGAAIDGGDGNWRLLFDATTDEGAVWQFRLPYDYNDNPVAKIGYTMASGTANEVEFEVFVMAVSDGDSADIGTASFDTVNVGSATVPGTVGYLDEISISLANADSMAAGDFVAINLSTDSDDATNDDSTGDREVVYFQLEYDRK